MKENERNDKIIIKNKSINDNNINYNNNKLYNNKRKEINNNIIIDTIEYRKSQYEDDMQNKTINNNKRRQSLLFRLNNWRENKIIDNDINEIKKQEVIDIIENR